MEIRTFAERLLFEPHLSSKLLDGGALTDAAPGPALTRIPDAPARDAALAFRSHTGRAKVKFPTGRALERDEGRGTVLHFFANHELLALELMALALLRFPDAPPAFRRGVVGIMRDEQRHLQFYLDRMAELGVSFGQVPLSDFFWSALKGVPDLPAFVAGMSLTLEQANLDFALHYARAFRQVGDEATGQVLDQVLRDEIRHVAHGRLWFERWKDPADSLWTAWLASLVFPMTPARAKAPPFDEAVRREAGLDDDFIERLRIFNRSKGRPPVVRWFDPTFEDDLRAPGGGVSKAVRALATDLQTLPALLCRDDDTVLVRARPDPAFLRAQQAAGLPVPEYLVAPLDAPRLPDDHPLVGRVLRALAPWGHGPRAAAFTAPLGTPPFDPALRALGGKPWAAQFRDEATVAHTLAAVAEAAAQVGGEARLKAAFGTAGRHQRRVAAPLRPADHTWIEAALTAHGAVVVEPEHERLLDLNVLLDITPEGAVTVLGVHRFLTDGHGGYRGGVIHPWLRGLPSDLARAATGGGDARRSMPAALEALGARVGAALAQAGHRGLAGIDALVARGPEGTPVLVAPLEVNPRTTMGHITRALAPRVAPGAAGWFVILRRGDLKATGSADFAALVARLAAALPPIAQHTPRAHWRQGCVPLTDPACAQQACAVLLVAPHPDQLVETWAAAGLGPMG